MSIYFAFLQTFWALPREMGAISGIELFGFDENFSMWPQYTIGGKIGRKKDGLVRFWIWPLFYVL